MDGLSIRPLGAAEEPPMHLLLLADPERPVVESYVHRGICAGAELNSAIVGTYILLKTPPQTVELVNIAVDQSLQKRGIGRQLVLHAIDTAARLDCRTIEVGTANSSLGPLALYQQCGFRIVGVDANFFTRRYKTPIYEAGIQCRDMLRLALHLDA